jgi:hypothetical protein
MHELDVRARVERLDCVNCGRPNHEPVAVVNVNEFLAALRLAIFTKSKSTVAMGLLRVVVQPFPLSVLKSIIRSTVEPSSARTASWEAQPVWDRQEASTLQWQRTYRDIDGGPGYEAHSSYILQTWDAVSSLCSFEGLLKSGSPDKYAFGPWLSAGQSGELAVVLPPVTISHRYEVLSAIC